MPRRTVVFSQIPWNGGINTAVDSGVIPANDLVIADNVVFSTNGARLKREGFADIEVATPAVVQRSSTGTDRSLVFAEAVKDINQDKFHVGEKIRVSGINAGYDTIDGTISAITTTNITDDTIVYTFSAAGPLTESTTASAGTVARNYRIIGIHDYWYFDAANGIKQQLLVVASSEAELYAIRNNGTRKYIEKDASATANAITPVVRCDLRTFNNKCIVTFEGVGNVPRYFDAVVGFEWYNLPFAPDGEFMMEHVGRLWMNDKTDKDFLHFCETFDETRWFGDGDSGAIYVGVEDGDPRGITGIAPPFKGVLLVSKGEKTFKIVGDQPETLVLQPMTVGLGGVNHKAWVPVDFDDVYFMSRRGFHSVVATDTSADYEANFLSAKIQPTFNTWSKPLLNLSQGVYLENNNSVVWSVVEDGQTAPSALWFYNPTIDNGVWFRWPDTQAWAVGKRLTNSATALLIGRADGRVWQSQTGPFDDNGADYTYRVKTGTIYPDNNAQTIKGFKRFSLLYRQKGRFGFQVFFKVDNQKAQGFNFTQNIDGDKLGEDFILGESILGAETYMAPSTRQVVGYGRGCTIEISQIGPEAQVEIYGFMVEYELADLADEVKGGGN